MDAQQSKPGKLLRLHSFWGFLPRKSPRLSVWCPWVPSGWVQSRNTFSHSPAAFFLRPEATSNEGRQRAVMYVLYIRSRRTLFGQSHHSARAQLGTTCPINGEWGGSVFSTRPCVSVDMTFTQERFRFVFALLMSSSGPFNSHLLKTSFFRD